MLTLVQEWKQKFEDCLDFLAKAARPGGNRIPNANKKAEYIAAWNALRPSGDDGSFNPW
jgi:hypothetical protein